jgi:hypothetical protein
MFIAYNNSIAINKSLFSVISIWLRIIILFLDHIFLFFFLIHFILRTSKVRLRLVIGLLLLMIFSILVFIALSSFWWLHSIVLKVWRLRIIIFIISIYKIRLIFFVVEVLSGYLLILRLIFTNTIQFLVQCGLNLFFLLIVLFDLRFLGFLFLLSFCNLSVDKVKKFLKWHLLSCFFFLLRILNNIFYIAILDRLS